MEANPGLINATDGANDTPLSSLVRPGNQNPNPLPLALWLLEKRADIPHETVKGTLLHRVGRLDLLNAFLARGANPTARDHPQRMPLITRVQNEQVDLVARLQDPRVRATLQAQSDSHWTALQSHSPSCASTSKKGVQYIHYPTLVSPPAFLPKLILFLSLPTITYPYY